jgi:mannose-6-phosphate isomerase
MNKATLVPASSSAPEILRLWFLNEALPIWSTHGVDRLNGGFFEKLDVNLIPSNEPRRARLVARQIYVFATAAALGWEGPSVNLIQHGLNFLRDHLVTSNGDVRASCSPNGSIIDGRQHLYDVAFVLLALARVAERLIDSDESENLARVIATKLSDQYQHPLGGYIDCIDSELQCSNPHMHLFEAFLAWRDLERPDYEFWSLRANELANLALERLILPESGLLPEYFDAHWSPLHQGGTLRIEPGHQFEWSWLLARWTEKSHSFETLPITLKLCSLAESYGVNKQHNVVIESINQQFLPLDYTARLWQQTERAKAWHTQTILTGNADLMCYYQKAISSLFGFLSGPCPGLWFDEMDSSGTYLVQSVKASSSYHIACAIETLLCPILNSSDV